MPVYPDLKLYEEILFLENYFEGKYCIENVRGGSFTSIKLSDDEKNLLLKKKNSAQNTCFKCGKYGHYANECDDESDEDTCFRCGRCGHFANECYAKYDVDGNYLKQKYY